MQPSSVRSLLQWSQLLVGLLTVFTALFPILANTSGSFKSLLARLSPGRALVGVAGDLRLLFGDAFRAETFLAGDALGEGDARGDAEDLGDGVLRDALEAVNRLVGLFKLGDPCAEEDSNPRVPGDFDLFLGELGTDNRFPLFRVGPHPPQQSLSPPRFVDAIGLCNSSSDSLSSLLFLYPSCWSLLIRLVSSPTPISFSPLKLRFILGEFVLAWPMMGLPGAELVLDILLAYFVSQPDYERKQLTILSDITLS